MKSNELILEHHGVLDDIRMKMEVLQLPEENNMIKILAKDQP